MRTQYCLKCGSILEKGAKFCTECGAKVTDATDIKGYGYTESTAEPASPAEPAVELTTESESYYNNTSADDTASAGSSPADTWAKADPFADAPKAPDVQPTAAYWSSSADPDVPPAADQQSWQSNAGGFQQMAGPVPGTASNQKTTILILGIVTIVFSVVFPLVSYICGIVGLVMASKAKKNGEDVHNGRICCIIGLVLAVLNSVVGILVSVLALVGEVFETFLYY